MEYPQGRTGQERSKRALFGIEGCGTQFANPFVPRCRGLAKNGSSADFTAKKQILRSRIPGMPDEIAAFPESGELHRSPGYSDLTAV